jgi:hypothetical protein
MGMLYRQVIVIGKLCGQKPKYQKIFLPLFDVLFAFRNAGWESLEDHLKQTNNFALIDSTVFRADPQAVLQAVTHYLGIAFDDKMVRAWSKGNAGNFKIGHGKSGSSPFIYKAVNSAGLEKPREKPIEIARFPESFHSYLLEIAIPIYINALMNEHTIKVHSAHDIERILEQLIDGNVSLKNCDPVFSYAIITTYPTMTKDHKSIVLNDLRASHGNKFGDVFDAIDSAVIQHNSLMEQSKVNTKALRALGRSKIGEAYGR